MLETWEPHIYSLENTAIEKLGDEQIDLIFATVSSEITDKIYENWDNFIAENHLENEIGLENEMLDMVKRDVSWACVERVVLHLSRQIFMLNLTERLCLLLDIDICQRRQVTWNR